MKRSAESRSALIALTRRELVRFIRQPSRIVAAVGTGAIVWLLLASGMAGSFVSPAITEGTEGGPANTYAAYLIPGMSTMIVLFASIFSAISLIQDRHAGFLQSVLVSPAPAWAIVGSKVAGAVIIAVLQGAIVLAAAPLVGIHPGVVGYAVAALALILAATFVSCIGMALAWRMDSVAGFHGVMNLVLLPLWVFSGAMFPVEGMADWMKWVARCNPLAWSTRAMGSALGTTNPSILDWGGALLAAAGAFALAWFIMGKRHIRAGGEEGAG